MIGQELFTLFILICFLSLIDAQQDIPIPLPKGGRRDVHGWLVMPIEHDVIEGKAQPIPAWFSHHVPEFWTNSPHDFQIILKGELLPTSSAAGEVFPLNIPHPPQDSLLNYQYSFTPPSPFSLNDLLAERFHDLHGVYYNGSFHSQYPREPQSLAMLKIHSLDTAIYLKENETTSYQHLRYLSHPRGAVTSKHFYLSHAIHAQPDFDQQIHATIDQCTTTDTNIHTPGSAWEIVGTPNTLEHRLVTGQVVKVSLLAPEKKAAAESVVSCTLTVLEDISCMIGPGFMDVC